MKNWDLLYKDIMGSLQEKLSQYLIYHHWSHTQQVLEMAEYIARQEQISEDEIILVKTAALFHDAGFISNIMDEHEDESIRLAKQILPNYGYSKNEIEKISGMIQATKIPQKPKTKLECILADADLEYLGTDNFELIGNKLYQELKHENPNLTIEEWNDIQIKFLQRHFYHTDYCIENRAGIKEKNLNLLIQQRKKAEEN